MVTRRAEGILPKLAMIKVVGIVMVIVMAMSAAVVPAVAIAMALAGMVSSEVDVTMVVVALNMCSSHGQGRGCRNKYTTVVDDRRCECSRSHDSVHV